MATLRDKQDIENYNEKSKFLNDNGWVTYYHDDNWIQEDWFEDLNIRVEYVGLNTDEAYEICKKTREKIGI